MQHPFACAALAAALILGPASAAVAQTSPAPAPAAQPVPPNPAPVPATRMPPSGSRGMQGPGGMRGRYGMRRGPGPDGAGALARAYRAIGLAEAVNGRSIYVGQARTHYAGAYARYHRRDARGADAEAMAAAALAQAALDAHAPFIPRGLEAPPAPGARPAPGTPPRRRPLGSSAPGPAGGPLAALVARDPTLENQTLAERANAALAAARRLQASNDRPGAMQMERLAHDLVRALGSLAMADSPPVRPGGRGLRRPLAP